MKITSSPVLKSIAITILLFHVTSSFSQYQHYTYPSSNYHPSNYYPREHDSAVTVMPKLIKMNFLYYGFVSSLNQHISFEYDRQLSDEVMLSGQVGIINSSLSQVTGNTTVGGGYFEGGVKLFLNPDYTRVGRHGYYTVEGLYLKPSFVVSVFSTLVTTTTSSYYVYPPPTTTNQYSYTGAAIMLNLGGQWMIAHTIVLDAYLGAGVSFSNAYSSNIPLVTDYYNYLTSGSTVPIAFTGGINIGLPF
jgi:hypothetical protein